MATRYWIGSGINWSDPANWSETSSGEGGASVPYETTDTAIFDGSSFIEPDFEIYATDVTIECNIVTEEALPFCIRIGLDGYIGLQNEVYISKIVIENNGGLESNNYDISTDDLEIYSGAVVNLGSSDVEIDSSGTFDIDGSGGQITITGGVFIWSEGPTINAESCTFLNCSAQGGATFNALLINNNVDSGGNLGWIFDSALKPFTIYQSSGIVNVEGCVLKNSIAEGGATFNAFTSLGNVNGGYNTGWIFEGEPFLILNIDDTISIVDSFTKLKSLVLLSIGIGSFSQVMLVGSSQQIQAIGYYDDGSNAIITQEVTWISSNTAAATIDSGGLIVTLATGITFITASLSTPYGLIYSRVMLKIEQLTSSLDAETAVFQQVPLKPDPNQTFNCVLTVDGRNIDLTFKLRWNAEAGYWAMTLIDSTTGNYLVDGIPLIVGVQPTINLLQPYGYLGIGSCYIINVSGVASEYPNDTNLGIDYIMLWGNSEI